MEPSRRSLFGLLVVAPVAIAETAKALTEAPEPPKLVQSEYVINNLPFPNREDALPISDFMPYGGGFYTGYGG